MSVIDARIPPPVVMLATAALMRAAAPFPPTAHLPGPARIAAAAVLGGGGLLVELAGIVSFARARTTPDPTHPKAARVLVTSGVYRFTRNPMYLGDLLMLLGWAAWLSSPLAAVGAVLFVAYIDAFQIGPEERALADLFGDRYAEFRSRVRRWL